MGSADFDGILEIMLDLIKESPSFLKAKIGSALEIILGSLTDLSTTVKLDSARKYILAKIEKQEDQIQELQQELSLLRLQLLSNNLPEDLHEDAHELKDAYHVDYSDLELMDPIRDKSLP